MRHPFASPLAAIAAFFATALFHAGCSVGPAEKPAQEPVVHTTYAGWPDAWRLQNDHVEAIVVPAVGRVMSFRFRGGANVFWEDLSLAGQRGDPTGKQWVNFGGDKTWPAPEAEWKNYTKYPQWMPPPGFDALPAVARAGHGDIVLTMPIDPFYGVRATRRISLVANEPAMTIATTFERVSGEPSKIGIWVITQFTNPAAVYVPVRADSMFPGGYFSFRPTAWPQLGTAPGVVKLTRDPAGSHKLGADADRMLWMSDDVACLVTSERVTGAEYPDRGASAEVYTNPDPKKYVELEMLGPLAVMKPGDKITRTSTYRLFRRTSRDPDEDARRILALH